MGSRSRRDIPGHQQRAKGAPTPPGKPQGKRTAAAAAPQPAGPPQNSIVVFPQGAVARIGEHPGIDGSVLDLYLMLAGGVLTVRLPVGAWTAISEAVQTALDEIPDELARAEAAQRAHASGLTVASGPQDIAREAAAQAAVDDKLRKGPTNG